MVKFSLQFTQKDFESFKHFTKAMERQLGNTVYVGADSCCLYFGYPPELSAMLRPFPKNGQNEQFEFNLVSSRPDK